MLLTIFYGVSGFYCAWILEHLLREGPVCSYMKYLKACAMSCPFWPGRGECRAVARDVLKNSMETAGARFRLNVSLLRGNNHVGWFYRRRNIMVLIFREFKVDLFCCFRRRCGCIILQNWLTLRNKKLRNLEIEIHNLFKISHNICK